MDGLACTECGRCMEFCPASVTGKTLSPKHLMEGLQGPDRRGGDGAGGGCLGATSVEGRRERGSGGLRRRAPARPRARGRGAQPAAHGQRHPGGGGLAVHDLRMVRRGLPGAHRARRHDRRDPPQRGPRGEPIPEGAERRLPQHGERRQPVGPAEVGATGLGKGPGRHRPRPGRWHPLSRPDRYAGPGARSTPRRRRGSSRARSCSGSAAPARTTTATARSFAPWPSC